MNAGITFISYALAAMSGICFITGIAVLSGGKFGRTLQHGRT